MLGAGLPCCPGTGGGGKPPAPGGGICKFGGGKLPGGGRNGRLPPGMFGMFGIFGIFGKFGMFGMFGMFGGGRRPPVGGVPDDGGGKEGGKGMPRPTGAVKDRQMVSGRSESV